MTRLEDLTLRAEMLAAMQANKRWLKTAEMAARRGLKAAERLSLLRAAQAARREAKLFDELYPDGIAFI